MSTLLGRLFGRAGPNNNNNNNYNFTLKAPLNRGLNALRKKSKETLKRKKNRGPTMNPMYPYGSIQSFESPTYLHETNNPLVPHTLGRKLYIACIYEKYDIAQSLINDIIETDKTQLDYIGENGTPLIVVAQSISYHSDAARINSPDSKAKVKEGIELIRKLIDAGANIEIHNHKFAMNSSIISLLVDIYSDMGLVPLYDIIHLLLDKGANLNIINDNGHTTLDIVNYYGPSDLAGEIFAKGGLTSEALAPELFEKCLELRKNALLTISEIDKEKLGKMLLRECIRPRIITPLILTYISEGADLDIRDTSNRTPLLLLCSKMLNRVRTEFKECDKVAVILIKAGANCNIVDRSGQTALMYSIFSRYYDTPRVLIEYGADLNIVFKRWDVKDSTALDLAIVHSLWAKDLKNANRKAWADSLVELIREKGGRTAKELAGTVVNWKSNPIWGVEPPRLTNNSTRVMNPMRGITNKPPRVIFNPMQKKGGRYQRKTRKLVKHTRR